MLDSDLSQPLLLTVICPSRSLLSTLGHPTPVWHSNAQQPSGIARLKQTSMTFGPGFPYRIEKLCLSDRVVEREGCFVSLNLRGATSLRLASVTGEMAVLGLISQLSIKLFWDWDALARILFAVLAQASCFSALFLTFPHPLGRFIIHCHLSILESQCSVVVVTQNWET